MVNITNPKKSWIAKHLGLQEFQPGSYAVKVRGTPGELIQDRMDQREQELESQLY